MQRRKFSREFKLEAVRLARDRGVAVAQAARDLEVDENMLRKGVRFAAERQHAFPGHGQMKPEQQEVDRLCKEVAKLKAERDILNRSRIKIGPVDRFPGGTPQPTSRGSDTRFACIARHRVTGPSPRCFATTAGQRDGMALRGAGDEDRSPLKCSDRTYGARRVWDDVLAEGCSFGLHRVVRLMRENGLRARPLRAAGCGLRKDTGEPAAVSDDLIDRAFEASAPNQKWIADFTDIQQVSCFLTRIIHIPSTWMAELGDVMSMRERGSETEKITINLGYVDLGRVDLLVQEGFYSNRSDFIRTAIRNQLSVQAEDVTQSISRHTLQLGLLDYGRRDLEAVRMTGDKLRINVVGLCRIAPDVTPELALATIESITVLGALQASAELKSALAGRIR